MINIHNDFQTVREILKNAIDMHIHSSPDLIPRKISDIEAAQQAKEAMMRAILLKNHYESTVGRAKIVQKIIGKSLNVFGGKVLNYSTGGINPEAVEIAIKMGAKEIWMPTIDSKNHYHKMKKKENKKGIYILNDDGKLMVPVYEVIKLIAESGIVLGTGHLSSKEIIILVKEARKMGVEKILITHPEWRIVNMKFDVQAELSKAGAYFERCLYFLNENNYQPSSFSTIVESIRKIGVESTVMSTDFGQTYNPSPVAGMHWYIEKMLENGFSQQEINTMVKRNPSNLLGI